MKPPIRARAYHQSMLVFRMTLLAAVGVVAACSSAAPGEQSGSRPPAPGSLTPASVQPSRVPDGPPASPGPIDLPAPVIAAVVAEVSRIAGVPVDQVIVRSAEYVNFPDAGLGCPVPGMIYTQVQVEGFKLVAQVEGGKTYDFRGTGPDTFRLCTSPEG